MMQDILGRIIEGDFDYENGSLDFSCAKIELTINAGEVYEGSFHINATWPQYAEGMVVTSDCRMECLTPRFTGDDQEINFRFHGENIREDAIVKGAFQVISNRGEYTIPFIVNVEHKSLQSSMGTIKNLFHFANLAKSNWREAVKLFYSSEFTSLFTGTYDKLYDSYRGLSVQPGNEQNVEEFLIQTNKKQKIEYDVEEPELNLELGLAEVDREKLQQEITVIRKGWGYTALQVECKGDFLRIEKDFLNEQDFQSDRCRIQVYIDDSELRTGKNIGQILLYNSYVNVTVPVTVRVGEKGNTVQNSLFRKRRIVELMEYYQAFRLNKISSDTWIKSSSQIVEQLSAIDENDVEIRLFQAQLLIADERYNEAGWLLDHASDLLEKYYSKDHALWAYYLYLTTLIDRQDGHVNQVTEEVKLIYYKDRSQWRVAWILLYLSSEYSRSSSGKWMFLEKQFVNGASSPVLYIEALHLLNSNPALLRKLDVYEQQVLYYGVKQKMLSEEVIDQMLYLFGKVKEYSEVLYKLLCKLYADKPDVRYVQEICSLLIKGNKVGTQYFEWYQKGVDAQLRITNLYEYYCMSLDLNSVQPLPKAVLMYFAYQCELDSEHSAYIYRYVCQHRDGLADLYDSYRVRIEHFVEEQIQKQNINKNLAALYQEVLTNDSITDENAGDLEKLLFAHQLCVEDERFRRVYVYQPGNRKPCEYVLQDNKAWIALYGNEATLVFEDAYGNRFIKNVNYTLDRLMNPGKFLDQVAFYVKDSIPLDLYLYEVDHREVRADNLERMKRLLLSDEVSEEIRKDIYLDLLGFFYDSDYLERMDEFLENFPVEKLNDKERCEVVRYLVVRERYEAAYHLIEAYTPYFVDPKTLARLSGEMIPRKGGVKNDVLLAASDSAFQRGKFNEVILEYLMSYFEGTTKALDAIWKRANASYIDCGDFAERMLAQMLYTGTFTDDKMEIFRYYLSCDRKPGLQKAFLERCAYDYFIHGVDTEKLVFDKLVEEHLAKEDDSNGSSLEDSVVCKLAYLKYYAENSGKLADDERVLVEDFLRDMMNRGIHLNFFRDLTQFAHLIHEMDDKTIVEYRSKPGVKVRIHYVTVHENGDSEEYSFEYMKEICPGIFFKEFVLFFGENLQYYIVEEEDEGDRLIENGNIQKSDMLGSQGTDRYSLINDMIISRTLQDYDTLDELMDEYYCKEYMNETLFKLV